MLRHARDFSICAADAEDAYQRSLEILLVHVDRLDDATVTGWLRTVVRNEALAIRKARQRLLAGEEIDFDGYEAELDGPDERLLRFDRVTRAAEALRSCKHDEVTALMLAAEGNTYDQIAELLGWTRTKVNRALTEGRARFRKAYVAIESGQECERWAEVLSAIVDGEASAKDMELARPHLRNCPACRAVLRELTDSRTAIRVVLPAGILAAPGSADHGATVLTRLYELLVGGLQDTALKVQAAVDAIGTGKAAAVAASAAAIAGGGIAAERVLEPARSAPVTAAAAPTASPEATPTATPAEEPAHAATPAPLAAAPAATAFATPAPRKSKPRPKSSEASEEFFGTPASPSRPAATAPSSTTPEPKSSSSGESEFFNP